jgi:GNAT superfamily N-acetyltransferase
LTIRRLGPADFDGCRALSRDRGWDTEDASWRFMLEAAAGFGLDDPAGGLAGCVFVARYGDEVASIGMMLVASRWGRQGLGRRLMEHALTYAAGRTVVLYATKFGRPLYERLGFRVTDHNLRYNGTYQAGPPLPAHVQPATAADLAAATRLDATAFGANRADLLGRLIAMGARLYVAPDGSGHAFARDMTDRLIVGPVTARDERTACALIDAHARQAAGPVRVDVPSRFAGVSAWLTERGMTSAGPFPLMVYGGDLPGDRTLLYAVASPALG